MLPATGADGHATLLARLHIRDRVAARRQIDRMLAWSAERIVLAHQGRRLYHAGDSAYFGGFKEIGERLRPEIALLPIGAYRPEAFRDVHMGPEEAVKAFRDLRAKWLVPMHYGTFRLSFEDMEEPPRWLHDIARREGIARHVHFLEEGMPAVF